jgi:hypothetical protein
MTVLDDMLATDVLNRGDLSAYMEPSTNNAISPAFLLLDIWRLRTMGIGILIIRQSTITPKAAVASYKAGRSMHSPVVMFRSQPLETGLQTNMEAKKIPVLAPMLMNMVAYVAHRNNVAWFCSWT